MEDEDLENPIHGLGKSLSFIQLDNDLVCNKFIYWLSSRYFSRSFYACFLNLFAFTLVHLSYFSLVIIVFYLAFVLSICYLTHDSYELL